MIDPGTRVALLSAGPPISLKVLYCLRALGLKVDLIDLGAVSTAKFSRYRNSYFQFGPALEEGEGERLASVLADYARRNQIRAVVPSDIMSAGALYEAQDFLSDLVVYPVSSPQTLDLLDDKWKFQGFMVEHGIPCPRAVLIENLDDLASLAKEGLTVPLVVKPLHGESGHGIFYGRTLGEIEGYLKSGSKYTRLPVMIQNYVPGIDADLSILAQDGEVKTQILQIRKDGYIIEFGDNHAVTAIGRRIAEAANFTGVANIDLRINEATGEATVLECNPRFWYTLQASMWRGLNFVEAGLAMAEGATDFPEPPSNGLYYLHGGLLKKVLWNPARWHSVKGYNLRGLLQALSDPMPFIRNS